MRLFLAVELPPAIIRAAASVGRALRTRVEDMAASARLTWIPAERMHLTVRFIGEVDAVRTATLVDVLSPPVAIAPFGVRLGGPGAFPARGAPRVLWLGLDDEGMGLQRLEQEVSRRLETAHIPSDPRAFSPHLTLARVREPHGLRSGALFEGLDVPAASGIVDAITLFESRLSPRGPAYTPMHRTRLTEA